MSKLNIYIHTSFYKMNIKMCTDKSAHKIWWNFLYIYIYNKYIYKYIYKYIMA